MTTSSELIEERGLCMMARGALHEKMLGMLQGIADFSSIPHAGVLSQRYADIRALDEMITYYTLQIDGMGKDG